MTEKLTGEQSREDVIREHWARHRSAGVEFFQREAKRYGTMMSFRLAEIRPLEPLDPGTSELPMTIAHIEYRCEKMSDQRGRRFIRVVSEGFTVEDVPLPERPGSETEIGTS